MKNNFYNYIYRYVIANLNKDNLSNYNSDNIKKYIEEYINVMYKYKYNKSTIKYNKQIDICEKPGQILYKKNILGYKRRKIFKPLYNNFIYKSGILTPNGGKFISSLDKSPDFTYSIYKYIYFKLKIQDYYTKDLKGLIDYKRKKLLKLKKE